MSLSDDAMSSMVQSCANTVLHHLGWGWKENVYREALAVELRKNVDVSTEVAHPVKYCGVPLSNVFSKVDLVVDGHVLLELKVGVLLGSSAFSRAHRQCTRYLRHCVHACDYGFVIVFPDTPEGDVKVVRVS